MDNIEVFTLVGVKNLQFSAICLKTFVNRSVEDIYLKIFDDGSLTVSDKTYLKKEIENCIIISKAERDAAFESISKQFPLCIKFRNENILAQKIIDLLMLEKAILFIDSDVLFLKNFRFPEFQFPTFIKDGQNAYVFHPFRLQKKFQVFPKINTGFFYFPFVADALSKLEEQLQNKNILKDIKRIPGWAEQTLWALLAGFFNTINYFDGGQIIMAGGKTVKHIPVAVHLVSTYRKEFDYYKQFLIEKPHEPATLSLVEATNKLSLFEYRIERLQKRIKRFL